jgi:hypothetical protein
MPEAPEKIVQKAHELTVATDFNVALWDVPRNLSLKNHLPNAISKPGRYYSISSELISRNLLHNMLHNNCNLSPSRNLCHEQYRYDTSFRLMQISELGGLIRREPRLPASY